MYVEAALALARHGLTTAGSWFVIAGWATPTEIDTVAGAVVAVAGFGWSMWRKWKRRNA